MRRHRLITRPDAALTLLFCGALVASCKTREPEQNGLLSEEVEQNPADETVADGGEFAVRCGPADDADNPGADTAGDTWLLQVKGAVSTSDESQPLIVDLDLLTAEAGGKAQRLHAGQKGRGIIDLQKSLFIGFESGVLTADADTGGAGGFTGVLSVASRVDGIQVRCQAKAITPGQE
jgi:hypothetical protein